MGYSGDYGSTYGDDLMPSRDYDYKVKVVDDAGQADWSVITVDGIDDLHPNTGDVLQWNGTAWVAEPTSGIFVPTDYLRKDGNLAGLADTTVSRANLGAAQALTPTAVKTGASYNAAAGDFVPVDTTSNPVTVNLPSAPADGTRIGVKLVILGGSNAVTIARGGTDVFNKTGGSTSLTLSLVNQAVSLQYKASSGIWYVVADDEPLSGLDARYAAASAVLSLVTYSAPGALSLTTGTVRVPMPVACTIKALRMMAGTAPTGAALIADVNKNGTTIFTTQANRPTIAIGANDSGAVTAPDVTALAAGDYLTVDIDQIGSTIAGSDLGLSIEVSIP